MVVWKKGQSGNPHGRPISARQKISESLLSDLAEVWAEHGKVVLTKLAVSDPGKLATIAYGLLPRDIFVHVQQSMENPNAHQMALLRGILDVIEASGVDGNPEAILEGIEQDLRARYATEIEPVGSKAVAIEYLDGKKFESVQSDSET